MALSSLYTPPSTQNQKNSGSLKGGFERGSYDLYTQLLPLLQRKLQYGLSLEPQQEAFLNQALESLTPEGMQELANHYRANVMGAATSAGQQQAGQLSALGLSKGAQAGAIVNQGNQATQAANNYDASLNSPTSRLQNATQGMNLINGAQNPDMSNFANLGSLIYGKPAAVHQQSPLGSLVGQVAGDYLSAQTGGAGGLKSLSAGRSAGNAAGRGIGSAFGDAFGGLGSLSGGVSDPNPYAGSGILGSDGNYTIYG